jgi:hypothetical protein
LAADIEALDDWLVEPLIPAHRSTAIVAEGGVGKSLIMLEIAAALATGRAVLLRPARAPINVVYIDMEMVPSDVADRLDALGYDFTNDPLLHEHLHYYQLQDFLPFDTSRGGRQLLAIAEKYEAELVIIDTLARVISGDENEAKTVQNFAAWTGTLLKQKGVAVVRLDHLGKNPEKGARGSSAKRDDIDLGWTMTLAKKNPVRFKFTREKTRVMWAPERVDLIEVSKNPLRHEVAGGTPTKEVADLIKKLDELGVPKEGRGKAGKALREAGYTASTDALAEAVAERKRRPGQMPGQD